MMPTNSPTLRYIATPSHSTDTELPPRLIPSLSVQSSQSRDGNESNAEVNPKRPPTGGNVYAYSEDGTLLLTLPREVCSATVGLANYDKQDPSTAATKFKYELCRKHHKEKNCTKGSNCEFIHSSYPDVPEQYRSRLQVVRVHFNTPIPRGTPPIHPVHEPGSPIALMEPQYRTRQVIDASQCYVTKGSTFGIAQHPTTCQHCNHFRRGMCARGAECNFVHKVPYSEGSETWGQSNLVAHHANNGAPISMPSHGAQIWYPSASPVTSVLPLPGMAPFLPPYFTGNQPTFPSPTMLLQQQVGGHNASHMYMLVPVQPSSATISESLSTRSEQ